MGSTNIALIHKCDQPLSMCDLRPISLCNVAYKILAKTLANRLVIMIPKCISEEQSAFVAERSIIDSSLIASKIVHYLKCKRHGQKVEIAHKIDISKAYDRVDWEYLRAIMLKLGFDHNWVNRIHMWVSSVHYSIVVNNEEVGPVLLRRGLRQGIPSPRFSISFVPKA